MPTLRLITLLLLGLVLLVSCSGGGSSDSARAPVYAIALEFERGDGLGGLDPFIVTAAITDRGRPLPGITPVITLARGSCGAVTDLGDGRYTFAVTPTQTGEYAVTVGHGGVTRTETALVFKSVGAGWGQPMAVSGLVNTAGYEDGVSTTPDGQYLFVQTGPIYFSAMIYFSAVNGCNGNRLAPVRCTHSWLDTTIGSFAAPERPGYFTGRIAGTTLRHNSNLWGIADDQAPIYAPITMFYGFRRQADGSYAEPFYIAFDDENDAIVNPYGLTVVPNDDGSAETFFALDDPADANDIDHDNDGIFDRQGGLDVYTRYITLGQNSSLGRFNPGQPPSPGSPFATRLLFGNSGLDGNYGTQGNPTIYRRADGTIHSVWTDDEYDSNSAESSYADHGDLSAYVLTSGTATAGTWQKVVLPATVNGAGDQIQPFFTGQEIFFTQDASIQSAAYTGSEAAAELADNARWSTAINVLEKDAGVAPLGRIVAAGEPNIATIDGSEYLFFVYAVVRGTDPTTGLPDLDMQTGYMKRSTTLLKPRP